MVVKHVNCGKNVVTWQPLLRETMRRVSHGSGDVRLWRRESVSKDARECVEQEETHDGQREP